MAIGNNNVNLWPNRVKRRIADNQLHFSCKLLPLVLVLVTEVPGSWRWVAASHQFKYQRQSSRGEDVIMKQFAARAAPTFRLQMGRVNKHVWFYDVTTLD